MKLRVGWLLLVLLAALTAPALGAELPREVERALPEGAAELMEQDSWDGAASFTRGISAVFRRLSARAEEILRQQLRGAAVILLAAVLCGAVNGLIWNGGGGLRVLPVVGALSVTASAAGSLDQMIGLGSATMDQLTAFSHVLLPALAAACAGAGAVTSAAVQQVAAVWFSDLLLQIIQNLLVPMVYLYIAALTAAACLPESRLEVLAQMLKKGIVWVLSGLLLAFTLYLSAARVLSGPADAMAVKVTKTAISGAVPVVGGILAEAAETVLSGAGMLRGTIGAFGMIAVVAACGIPFLKLGIQYLLLKLTAVLAASVGPPELCRLIDGLGGAFGLVLGMTGSCALLVLISVLSAAAVVTP